MTNLQQKENWNGYKGVGNTVEWFRRAKDLISINDGKRACGMTVSYCHDQQAAFDFSDHTQIEIMSPSFDVSNVRKGFITARCLYNVQIAGLTAAGFQDSDHLGKLFIGYKASCQAVRRLQLYHKEAATNYLNEYIIQEGVAFATTRPFTAKDKKRFIYTLYENASRYMPDVCGTYINIADFIDGQAHPVVIEFNIPVIDFLVLQCFEKWLKEFGKLTLEIYLAYHSLVVCSVNPRDVLENKQFLQTDTIQYPNLAAAAGSSLYGFDHRFTQIGDQFRGFTLIGNSGTAGSGTTTFTTGNIRVFCNNATCQMMTSTIRGYGITDNARAAVLASLDSDGLVIPCQQLIWKAFPTGPDEAGVETTLDIPYENITASVVVFPKTSNQITCFENPMLDGVYLKVDERMIPNQPYNSTGARFLQEQLIINDLDGNLQGTAEFTNSIINERNAPDGTRYLNSLSDDTAFLATFQLERGDSGYVFDGYVSNGSVNTLIKGSSRFKGAQNTYLFPSVDSAGQTILTQPNKQPPQYWMCRDTFCVVKRDYFAYESRGTPPGSQTG